MATRIKCGDCGTELSEGTMLCPKCGSKKKAYSVTAETEIGVSPGFKMTHKRPGKGTLHEQSSLHRPSADFEKYPKGVRQDIIINRENKPSTYDQVVTDSSTGKVTHEEHTSLKRHNENKKNP